MNSKDVNAEEEPAIELLIVGPRQKYLHDFHIHFYESFFHTIFKSSRGPHTHATYSIAPQWQSVVIFYILRMLFMHCMPRPSSVVSVYTNMHKVALRDDLEIMSRFERVQKILDLL